MNPATSSFYTREELHAVGLKAFGNNVLISRHARIYNPGAIVIGDHVRIDDFCVVSGGAGIEMGSYIHIAAFTALYGSAGIVLGDFTGLSARVTLHSESDDYSGRTLTNPMTPERYRTRMNRGQIVLKKHTIIGTNTTIMPGVTVGEGTAVGAHSFVTKSCAEWSIYFGAPARRISRRRTDVLEHERQIRAALNEGTA